MSDPASSWEQVASKALSDPQEVMSANATNLAKFAAPTAAVATALLTLLLGDHWNLDPKRDAVVIAAAALASAAILGLYYAFASDIRTRGAVTIARFEALAQILGDDWERQGAQADDKKKLEAAEATTIDTQAKLTASEKELAATKSALDECHAARDEAKQQEDERREGKAEEELATARKELAIAQAALAACREAAQKTPPPAPSDSQMLPVPAGPVPLEPDSATWIMPLPMGLSASIIGKRLVIYGAKLVDGKPTRVEVGSVDISVLGDVDPR
jgi:hypothetical protein